MVYQRLYSILEQIQSTFSVEVSDHIAGDKRSVLAFSYSKLINKRSSARFRKTYTAASTIPLSP